MDKWLTERYCLFLEKNDKIYRYDVHHKEWGIKNVELNRSKVNYKFGDMNLNMDPDLTHYSDEVKVLTWLKVEVNTS